MGHVPTASKTDRAVSGIHQDKKDLMDALMLSCIEAKQFVFAVEQVWVFLNINAIDVPQAILMLEQAGILVVIREHGEETP